MRALLVAISLLAAPALGQTVPPTGGPTPSTPRPCTPMPECLVLIGPGGGENDGPLPNVLGPTRGPSRSLTPATPPSGLVPPPPPAPARPASRQGSPPAAPTR